MNNKNVTANYGIGRIEITKGNIKGAEYFFKLVLELSPNDHRAFIGLAQIAISKRKYSKAVHLFKKINGATVLNRIDINNYVLTGKASERFNEYGLSFSHTTSA